MLSVDGYTASLKVKGIEHAIIQYVMDRIEVVYSHQTGQHPRMIERISLVIPYSSQPSRWWAQYPLHCLLDSVLVRSRESPSLLQGGAHPYSLAAKVQSILNYRQLIIIIIIYVYIYIIKVWLGLKYSLIQHCKLHLQIQAMKDIVV